MSNYNSRHRMALVGRDLKDHQDPTQLEKILAQRGLKAGTTNPRYKLRFALTTQWLLLSSFKLWTRHKYVHKLRAECFHCSEGHQTMYPVPFWVLPKKSTAGRPKCDQNRTGSLKRDHQRSSCPYSWYQTTEIWSCETDPWCRGQENRASRGIAWCLPMAVQSFKN